MAVASEPPEGRGPETAKQKSERLKAIRLQAEQERHSRVDRATRKAAARRKILGDKTS